MCIDSDDQRYADERTMHINLSDLDQQSTISLTAILNDFTRLTCLLYYLSLKLVKMKEK